MLYLTPPTSNPVVHQAMRDRRIGFIKTPAQGNALIDGALWCADNGCFGKGYPGDAGWLRWLESLSKHAHRCLFATAPDVVGDAEASLARSLPLLPKIRERGFKAALVAQDGMEDMELPWNEFDVLFLGGAKQENSSDEWKLGPGARLLAAEARRRGLWVHAGRVNSNKRYRYFAGASSLTGPIADSCDGTFIRFAPDRNIHEILGWVDGWRSQDLLF